MYYNIHKNLTLCTELSQVPVTESKYEKVNHILCIDCSGSMSSSLPKIREQLKNKIPSLVCEGDTVSLIWFSGKSEYSRLADKVEINSIKDFTPLNVAIDRWLKPIGLTGFVDPLKEVFKLASETSGVNSLFFLTDGCDNENSKNNIIDAVRSLNGIVGSTTFVEYGWYCNRNLLIEMTENVGGALVFCEDFSSYIPVVDNFLSNNKVVSKFNVIKIEHKPLFGFVFSMVDNTIVINKVNEKNEIKLPSNITNYNYFIERINEESKISTAVHPRALLAGLLPLIQVMKAKYIRYIIEAIGDYNIYSRFSNCYGKQNYTEFLNYINEMYILSTTPHFSIDRTPFTLDMSQFCLLDLFEILMCGNNKIALDQIDYEKMSRDVENSMDDLSDEEVHEFSEKMAKAKTKKDLDTIQKEMKQLIKSKPKKLKFVADKVDGYPISDLVWNESRPNLSIRVYKKGYVTLPASKFVKDGILPKKFPTNIIRSYNVICDGIAHMKTLPAILDTNTHRSLSSYIELGKYDPDKVYDINLRNIPSINECRIIAMSAKNLARIQYQLLKSKAEQKVVNAFSEPYKAEKRALSYEDDYGTEASIYLKDMGITSSGFSPKMKQSESTDNYMGIELNVNIAGINSLPTYKDFVTKIVANKPLTPRELLMKPIYDEISGFKSRLSEVEFKNWINHRSIEIISLTRELIKTMVMIKFSTILSQEWFLDLEPNQTEFELDLEPNNTIKCSIELKDVVIKI